MAGRAAQKSKEGEGPERIIRVRAARGQQKGDGYCEPIPQKVTPMSKQHITPASAANELPADDDLFDPAKLRVTGDALNAIGVEKLLTTVPVRRPNRQQFFQIHPDEAYRLDTMLLELKEEGEFHLITSELVAEFDTPGARLCRIYTYVNRNKVAGLWPIPLPEADGRENEWHRSAHAAALVAMQNWIRIVPDRSLNGYTVCKATGDIEEPVWPKVPLSKLLSIAFGEGRFIRDADHPVLRRLRGLV